jgi:hypothetical protein
VVRQPPRPLQTPADEDDPLTDKEPLWRDMVRRYGCGRTAWRRSRAGASATSCSTRIRPRLQPDPRPPGRLVREPGHRGGARGAAAGLAGATDHPLTALPGTPPAPAGARSPVTR